MISYIFLHPAEPLTKEAIWHATRNYEQRQQCLRSETDEVAVSAVSGPSPRKKKCRTCGKACGFNRQTQEYFDYCSVHKDTSCDFSEMECDLAGCSHPKGSHNDKAHKLFGRGQKTYQSRPPRPRDGKGSSRDSSWSSPKRGRSPPGKFSKQNSQNRDAVSKSKGESAAVSSIAVGVAGDKDLYLDTDSELEYIAVDYEDFATSCVSSLTFNQVDGAMTDEEMRDNSSDDEGGSQKSTLGPQTFQMSRREENWKSARAPQPQMQRSTRRIRQSTRMRSSTCR